MSRPAGRLLTRPLEPDRVRTLDWSSDDTALPEVIEQLRRMTAQLARAEAGDDEHPHPRNSVMNMVALVQDREHAHSVGEIMADLAAHHPSRSIVLHRHSHGGAGRLAARIRCDAHALGDGFPIQHEQVTLHMGASSLEHVRSIVEPLLISDVRTHLWWTGTPPLDDAGIVDVLTLCNTLVVDSASFDEPYDSLLALARLAAEKSGEMGLADFHWARATVWRALLAQFFEPSARRVFLAGIKRVEIEHVGQARADTIASAMVAGWLAAALGWELEGASSGAGGALTCAMRSGTGSPVEIAFRAADAHFGSAGEIAAVRVEAQADGQTARLEIAREGEDAAVVDIRSGAAKPIRQRVVIPASEDAELLVDLLVQGRMDPVYLRSLRAGAQLLEAAS